MSSESGLKQRKVAAATSSNNNHSDSKNFDNDLDGRNSDNEKNEENEEYDADSKETRLTLMEEILLLGLKDREVCILKLIFKQRFFFKLKMFYLIKRDIPHFGTIAFPVV